VARRIAHHNGLTGWDRPGWIESEPGVFASHASRSSIQDKIRNLEKPSFIFAFTREPLEREVSSFYHFGLYSNHVLKGKPVPTGDHRHHLMLKCMGGRGKGDHIGRYLDSNPSFLSPAAKLLSEYHFVGSVEMMDESLAILSHILQVPVSQMLTTSSKNTTAGFALPHPKINDFPAWVQEEMSRLKNSSQYKRSYEIHRAVTFRIKEVVGSCPAIQTRLKALRLLRQEAHTTCQVAPTPSSSPPPPHCVCSSIFHLTTPFLPPPPVCPTSPAF
jgi:hypothetical protein